MENQAVNLLIGPVAPAERGETSVGMAEGRGRGERKREGERNHYVCFTIVEEITVLQH